MNRALRILAPILILIIFLAIWEWALPLWGRKFIFLSKPSLIFTAINRNITVLARHAKVTFFEMSLSWFLAALLSIPLGYMMHATKWMRIGMQPLFILVQCMPMFTLAPLMLLIFGWGSTAIIIPTVLMIFFPLTISVYQGLLAMPLIYHEYASLHQTSNFRKYIKLQFPFSLPHLMNGLKVSTAIAGIGAIAGEWAGAQEGLGIYMIECRRNMDFECLFAAIFFLVFLTLLFYSSVFLIEKILIRRRYV